MSLFERDNFRYDPSCKTTTDPDETRSYQLTLREWRKLADDDQIKDIENVVRKGELIGERIWHLIEDINACKYDDDVDEQIDWDQVTEDLRKVNHRPAEHRLDETGATSIPGEDVWIELGRAIGTLCESGAGDRQYALKGLIRGLLIDSQDELGGKERVEYTPAESVEEYVFEGANDDESSTPSVGTEFEQAVTILEPEDDLLTNSDRQGIDSVSKTLSELESDLEAQPILSMLQKQQLQKSRQAILFPTRCVDKAIKIAEITPTDTIRERVHERVEFADTIVPRSPEKQREKLTECLNGIMDMSEYNSLCELEDVAENIYTDIETLRNEEYRSVTGWELFREIGESSTPVDKRDIQEDKYANGVTYLLTKMSGQKDPKQKWQRGEQWVDRPVIEETTRGEWDTTDWGEKLYNIVCQTMTKVQSETTNREQIVEYLHSELFANNSNNPATA